MKEENIKNVYFVRHAESNANAGGEYKGRDSLLSEKGKTQAQRVAERFKNIPFDIVITSQFTRAIETGKAIADASGKPIAPPVELFGERQHPNEAIGLLTSSPEYLQVREETWKRFENGDPAQPGEENFEPLQVRAAKAVTHLENVPEKNIVVVTHGNFMRFLVMYICLRETLTPKVFVKFVHSLKISNTGITHLELKDGQWTLHQWNDKAHLG